MRATLGHWNESPVAVGKTALSHGLGRNVMRESKLSWLVSVGFERLRISSGTPNTPESRPSTSSAVDRELPRSRTSETGIGWQRLDAREADLREEGSERLEEGRELEERLVDAGALEATNELARLGVVEELRDLVLVERAEGAALVVGRVEVAPLRGVLLERVDGHDGADARRRRSRRG